MTAIPTKPHFEFDAGAICLNFANTVWERPGFLTPSPDAPYELLETYADLLLWARTGAVISDQQLRYLESEARNDPGAAYRAYISARALREAIFAACLHLALQRDPNSLQLEELNERLAASPHQKIKYHHHLSPQSIATAPVSPFTLTERSTEVNYIELIVLRDVVRLLTTAPIDRLRVCAAEDCGWLFLDTSKNGKRRWCSMSDCGNRAKANRFQSRKKVATSAF